MSKKEGDCCSKTNCSPATELGGSSRETLARSRGMERVTAFDHAIDFAIPAADREEVNSATGGLS